MAFTFAARTLLELGKELISTDEVAIYELIKNGVDAQYDVKFDERNVGIRCRVVILRSDYENALRRLDAKEKTRDVFAFLEGNLVAPPESEQAKTFLGRLQPTIGKRALFRNALKKAYANENWLEISDRGTGMSLEDLTSVFLHIGTRSRRKKNLDGATYLGDKGVGRLSAMRIGDMLKVTTTRSGDDCEHVLEIDWSKFSHDSDQRADEISIVPFDGEAKDDPNVSGTSVRVLNLNADWTKVRFQEILQGRVARMVDPFQIGRANKLITADYNGATIGVPSIPKELLGAAHATLTATFRFEEGTPVLDGLIDYKLRHRSRRIDARGAEIYSLSQQTTKRRGKKGHAAVKLVTLAPGALEKLGPFSVDLYWYNRLVVQSVENLSEGTRQTRQRIAEWAGGPMLYRHDFRVLPYGDKDDDWLALDEGAFKESGFKLNRQQVIGRVSIASPHTSMSEQTNREGLVESEAAEALKSILRWLIHSEMKDLIKEADAIEKLAKRNAQEDATRLKSQRAGVEEALADLRTIAGPTNEAKIQRLSKEVASLTAHASSLVERLDRVVAEAEDEREKFVYLAGVGLMTEFIFHELDRAVTHTLSELTRASKVGGTALLDSLAAQLATLHKRIAAFDEMTGEKRQTKSNFDLNALIESILETHSNEFARHSVVAHFERPEVPFPVRAVRGMVIQIVENLVTNALYWLKQQSSFETSFKPKLWIVVDPVSRTLSVEDNGPGVASDRRERIFQPFVTSKPVGQGRGLGLFISRELAAYHDWKLSMDETVGRHRTDRSNMFVLTMS